MALLCLLDDLHRDGRAQALVATHSPILLAHPGADLLWIDGDGITRRPLADIPHWRDMRRFMADPAAAAGVESITLSTTRACVQSVAGLLRSQDGSADMDAARAQ